MKRRVINSKSTTAFSNNENSEIVLFAFPPAGADAFVFRCWAELLPDFVELRCIQLPGRGQRISEAPFTELQPLLDSLHEELHSDFERPCAFFGHSMGSLVAFELARRLDLRTSRLSYLFVSGRRPPHEPELIAPGDCSDQQLIRELRDLEGTPTHVLEDPELLSIFLPVLRADFRVCRNYAYQSGPPLSCPISAMAGRMDRWVNYDLLNGWRRYTRSCFEISMIPGNHFYLTSAASTITSVISKCLQRVRTCL